MNNYDLFKKFAENFKLNVSRETFEQFEIYAKLLKEWNEKINLTAITEDSEIFLKHFLDSISIYSIDEIHNCKKVIDVGTGAGFPGLPMKIVKPEISLTLLDPLNKRLVFLENVINDIGLKDIKLVHGRAEDVSRETKYRDKFDLSVTRAVSSLPIVAEYCLPYVRKNGIFAALKGPNISQELNFFPSRIKELSGHIENIIEIKDIDDFNHNIVVIRKLDNTPKEFPRKNTLIKKDIEKIKSMKENT